jgi:hypothetical protein
MKGGTEKLQYVVAKRNGRTYRVFLNDLRRIRLFKHRNHPKVPEWEEDKFHSDGETAEEIHENQH